MATTKRTAKRAAPKPTRGTPMMTIRLSDDDRALLRELVALANLELAPLGVEASASSVLRVLIRREALARGVGMVAGEEG